MAAKKRHVLLNLEVWPVSPWASISYRRSLSSCTPFKLARERVHAKRNNSHYFEGNFSSVVIFVVRLSEEN